MFFGLISVGKATCVIALLIAISAFTIHKNRQIGIFLPKANNLKENPSIMLQSTSQNATGSAGVEKNEDQIKSTENVDDSLFSNQNDFITSDDNQETRSAAKDLNQDCLKSNNNTLSEILPNDESTEFYSVESQSNSFCRISDNYSDSGSEKVDVVFENSSPETALPSEEHEGLNQNKNHGTLRQESNASNVESSEIMFNLPKSEMKNTNDKSGSILINDRRVLSSVSDYSDIEVITDPDESSPDTRNSFFKSNNNPQSHYRNDSEQTDIVSDDGVLKFDCSSDRDDLANFNSSLINKTE